ncbi:MAG: hypothetical protein GY708_08995 [Actinomycetia bacterium]|nr:hypothetical protein [Actinomycetes bacterium]
MASEKAPVWLRPIHRWFFLWEDVIPSLYRVVAVTVAAGIITTLAVITAGTRGLIALPLAVLAWIALGVAQEHDERVKLDVDTEFETLLRQQLDPVLAAAGFTFSAAVGPLRAHPDRTDTFLYEAPGPDGNDCLDVWIRRDRSSQEMESTIEGVALERLVADRGDSRLAARVTRAEGPGGDVAALVAAFSLTMPAEDTDQPPNA